MGGFDLNAVDEDAVTETVKLSSSDGSVSSSSVSSGSASPHLPAVVPTAALSSSVCLELWHACAGRLITLPKKGTCVVYFPQGHLELLPEFSSFNFGPLAVTPHVFCRVTDVVLQVLHISLLVI